jgi:endonuclease/exonuclease/phosphatase family metal-dependent hydrolase
MHSEATRRPVRVVTYNIHKCRGLDRRVRPQRITDVLRELDADVIALQEVLCLPDRERGTERDHAGFIAASLDMHLIFGETHKHDGCCYGNALLTRFPPRVSSRHDLSARGREPRGCLHAELELPRGASLHVFNLHLGTSFFERRHQASRLLAALTPAEQRGPRIVLGDFNEWTRGLTTRLLRESFSSADVRAHLRRSRTYPGVLPFLHLDHVYFDSELKLQRLLLHRNRRSLIASDHLPLVAEFSLPTSAEPAPARVPHPS